MPFPSIDDSAGAATRTVGGDIAGEERRRWLVHWSRRRATQQAAALLVEQPRTPPNSTEGENPMEEGVSADGTPRSRRGSGDFRRRREALLLF